VAEIASDKTSSKVNSLHAVKVVRIIAVKLKSVSFFIVVMPPK
jgi:hypothetical protein